MFGLVVWGRFLRRLGVAACGAIALAGCGGNDQSASAPPACQGPADSPRDRFVAVSPAELACGLGRGVNLGNMFDAPEEGLWNVHYDPDALTQIRAAGFSHIRLPVRWSNHAAPSADATLDEAFAARIDDVIELALEDDLYVVMDVHHYRELDGDALDAGEAPADPEALDERLLNIWKQLAARYQHRSHRLIYELYNEPHGRLTPPVWNALAARVLTAVRELEPERVVILGASEWNEPPALAALEVPDDPNLIVTFHHYEPYHFTFQGTSVMGSVPWIGTTCCDAEQQAVISAGIDAGAAFAREHSLPVYLGEWGSSQLADVQSRVHYSRFVRDRAEAKGIPWAIWSLIDLGIYDPSLKQFDPELKEALLGR